MSLPKVSAIVLNYNGKDITLQALESLLAMDYENFEVIHVDNGSSDGSFEAVAEAFPQVVQAQVKENQGAAHGLNVGMATALQGDCDYLLFLNNDIEVEPELLAEMVAVAEKAPDIGCVGPKSYYYWDRERLWAAGGIIRFKESVTRERGMGQIDRGQFDRDEEVDYINGCAMLVRRSAAEAAGYWDPLFHLAVEDADWCMRMKAHGFRCYYSHRAILYHMVSHTAGAYQARRTYLSGRSGALFVRRYGGPLQWLTFFLFTAVALPLAFLRELPKGNQEAAIAKMRGVWAGLRAPMTAPPQLGDLELLSDAG